MENKQFNLEQKEMKDSDKLFNNVIKKTTKKAHDLGK